MKRTFKICWYRQLHKGTGAHSNRIAYRIRVPWGTYKCVHSRCFFSDSLQNCRKRVSSCNRLKGAQIQNCNPNPMSHSAAEFTHYALSVLSGYIYIGSAMWKYHLHWTSPSQQSSLAREECYVSQASMWKGRMGIYLVLHFSLWK